MNSIGGDFCNFLLQSGLPRIQLKTHRPFPILQKPTTPGGERDRAYHTGLERERENSVRMGERGAAVMAERPFSPADHRLGLWSDWWWVVVVWTRETMVEGGGERGLSVIV
ncbi:hypothetical protein HanXRQr2_Chr12g0534421 [Helianthus annuus]|uniref:Uncharacterized protein n=2 Tax=Helianthus annuus TaxID=4232 RepID=A0A9K3MVG1_HELAN|nr:hypothetical protein HanXRQr2_Chr12g0534421 [Helianthus annuus]KAJ0488895.1 hypothetical protein HanHA300_Chr12g0437931 [Helianthus annuus]KAJ0504735.1 hypothetical protein HanHA89_Chr12g0462591 [Helianthus annuus]KAJ0674467.1 hypothetical protein HanLR1_Chr12g0440271 [Helianthus annuus]KAJ0862146.1 hypothetical protein HanPSC8_Chr12g0514731 [Helianthus annuus]